jgi:hypothetical protein
MNEPARPHRSVQGSTRGVITAAAGRMLGPAPTDRPVGPALANVMVGMKTAVVAGLLRRRVRAYHSQIVFDPVRTFELSMSESPSAHADSAPA